MRKLLILLGIVAFAFPAFAQFVPTSMEFGLTSGLFENEVDQGFQVNPDFGTYAKDFLFAGLGNPYAGIPLYNEMDAFDITLTFPLMFGFYSPKLLPVPLSFFAAAQATDLANRGIPSNYSTPTYASEPVTTGTTTTNVQYVTQQFDYTFTDVVIANETIAGFQALTKVGPAALGLFFYMDKDNSGSDVAGAENFFLQTVYTDYTLTSAPATTPVTATNYSTTEIAKNIDAAGVGIPGPGGSGLYAFDTTIQFGVPVAIKTGNLDHRAYIALTLASTDQSGSYSNTETAHTYTAGGAANLEETLDLVDKGGTTTIDLGYNLRMPAGGTTGNEWRAGISVGVDLNGAEYTYDSVVRPYNLSVLAAKTALAGGTHISEIATYATTMDFGVLLRGARVFDFAFGTDVNYRFAPTVSLGVSTTSNGSAPILSQTVLYTQVLDATGAYNGAAYNSTTTAVSGNPSSTFDLDCGLSLPMGLKLKPAGWVFSFLFGATPSISVTMSTTTTSAETTTLTVENITGTTVNTTGITPSASVASSTTTYDYVLTEAHYIGISAAFSGGVRLDARLNGTLLTFEGFTIQAVIPFN